MSGLARKIGHRPAISALLLAANPHPYSLGKHWKGAVASRSRLSGGRPLTHADERLEPLRQIPARPAVRISQVFVRLAIRGCAL
jgi:hypothetical protein